jgi:hypothetical protein
MKEERMKKKLFLGALTLLVCAALAGIGQNMIVPMDGNPPLSGTVTIKKADYAQYNDFLTKFSTAWEDMPYMTKSFKISGTGKDEVIVMFQGQWYNCFGQAAIRLFIDGVLEGDTRFVKGDPNPNDTSTNGFIWTTRPLSAGVTHRASIKWLTYTVNGATVRGPSMVIFHR